MITGRGRFLQGVFFLGAAALLPFASSIRPIVQAQQTPLYGAPGGPPRVLSPFARAIQASDSAAIEKLLAAEPALMKVPDAQGFLPLHQAVRWRDADMVKLLLDKGADINSVDREGKTALHHAILSRQHDITSLLLQRDADLKIKSKPELNATIYNIPTQNVLLGAYAAGNIEGLKLLIERGANLNEDFDGGRLKIGDFLLGAAAASGNLEFTRYLLQKMPAPKYDLLQQPIRRGDKAMVEFLLANQVPSVARPVEINENVVTPEAALHWAARWGQKEIAETLLAQDAVKKAFSAAPAPVLSEAIANGHTDIARLLLEKAPLPDGGWQLGNALRQAVFNKDRDLIEMLVKAGARHQDPLLDAALRGDLEQAKKARSSNTTETPADQTGVQTNTLAIRESISPLHVAALVGQTDMAQWLLDNGFAPTLTTASGQTPLHWAVLSGNAPLVKLLLDKGADANALDALGQRPLHVAATGAGPEVLSLLLDKGAQLDAPVMVKTVDRQTKVTIEEPKGMTPLLRAAWSGNSAAVAFLIERGANVNYSDWLGLTPLLAAAQMRDAPSLKLLIDKGAPLDQLDKSRRNALHYVIEGRQKVSRASLSTQPLSTPFSSNHAALPALELLLERGLKLTARDNSGRAPLDIAVQAGDIATVGLLLDKGANINAYSFAHTPMGLQYPVAGYLNPTSEGATPLHQAAAKGDVALAKFLLARGADKNALDAFGRTPLDIAERRGEIARHYVDFPLAPQIDHRWGPDTDTSEDKETHRPFVLNHHKNEIARLLREAGAAQGSGLFFEAARNGATRLVRELLKQNPALIQERMEINRGVNGKGGYLRNPLPALAVTPLLVALRENQLPVVQLLLEQGAARDLMEKPEVQTLMHEAAKAGNASLVQVLLDNGFSVNARDGRGKTALHIAAASGSQELTAFLIERGAEVNALDNNGLTPLNDARPNSEGTPPRGNITVTTRLPDGRVVEAGGGPIAELLIAKGARRTKSLSTLASEGDIADLQARLQEKPTLLTEAGAGRTALFTAATAGQAEVVRWLVKNGVDPNGSEPNASGASRQTPLIFAINANRRASVVALIEAGANVNFDPDENQPERWTTRNTPNGPVRTRMLTRPALFAAIAKGDKEMVTLLLERGAKLDVRDAEGTTPLRWAEQNQKLEIVELLKARGAL